MGRSTEYFGSSYAGTNEGIIHISGIFNSDPRFNPCMHAHTLSLDPRLLFVLRKKHNLIIFIDFYNWHRVYIHYCDGSLFMSDVEQIDPVRPRNLLLI